MDILAALYEIKYEADNGTILDEGICFLVNIHKNARTIHFEHLIRDWPYFSGNPYFPIEGSSVEFHRNGKWKGKRGKARRHFVNYLITRIEEGDIDFLWDVETSYTEIENLRERLAGGQ